MYRTAIIAGRPIYRAPRNSFYIRDRCNFEIERVLSEPRLRYQPGIVKGNVKRGDGGEISPAGDAIYT